jgi:type I restriction-modification system DNA methylase subunit
MGKNEAIHVITQLVERFEDQYNSYRKSDYNETQTRRDFIDPFFKTLGWDIDNNNGYAEAYREVIHEDRIKIGGATKAPDYSFRLVGGKRLFFVEAKKPSISVKDEVQPAYQVRRYGWSAKLPISIITDFEEFAIYDCTKKPNTYDKASVARIKYLTFKEYIKEFDFIWNTFSKERVLKGSFDQFILNDTNKKGTATVDKEFLISLDHWRTLIAIDICKQNKSLDEDDINFAVQQTIDRLIFLRIAEDRGVEPYGRLKDILSRGTYYSNLYDYYLEADQKYNSGLFNFKKDNISKDVIIDNKVLKTIVNQLYYPESPYEFSVLSVEILGSAYEQFLGKQIKIDSLHRARIEEKPDVRKAGGVYYTPQYIVEYIVKQTIGKLVDGKKPKDLNNLKILDPACGSGSFLIGAYEFLLNWHKDYYTKKGQEVNNKKKYPLTPEGNLTTAEKKRILINNIFGVDLDVNAVEVTKLSLLLKCMEGETAASIATQLSFFNDRVLPTLDNNIKSGNSLIDTDFYDIELEFDVEKAVKPFNWKKEFPEVFTLGGFDVVLGNPPYGAELSKDVQRYCLKKYPIGNTDTAALFMIQAKHLLKEGGYNGYIIPKPFTYASNWLKTRSELLDDINIIVDCSKVWREVKLEMTIYISQNGKKTNEFISCIREGQSIREIGNIKKSLCREFNFIINGVSCQEIKIAMKMIKSSKRLNNYLSNKRGGMFQRHVASSGDLDVIAGKQVQRYFVSNGVVNKVKRKNITDDISFINDNSILVQNIVAHIQNPYPRIQISATTVEKSKQGTSVILDTVNQLTNKSELSTNYLLGVLNSKIIGWYTYKFIYANAVRTMHFDSSTTDRIPFPDIDLQNKEHKQKHDTIAKYVEQIQDLKKQHLTSSLQSKKDQMQNKIDYLQSKINELVCELFGLSKEEYENLN